MLSLTRHIAQSIRHNPRLSFLDPLWPVLRKPYLKFMNTLGQRRGIVIEIGGCKMRLHPAFCTLSLETIEVESFRAFAEAVRPGHVVFDIGASIGPYTLIALEKAGPSGRVAAYEPHDYAREYLIRHLQWNAAGARAIVRDVCCGASNGIGEFYCVPGQLDGMNGLVPVEGFQKRTVELVTVDDETERLGMSPDIIKIDVEGAEWDVLKGAEKTLRKKLPILFLSLHPSALAKRGESAEQVLAWLRQRGFEHEIIATDHETHVLVRPL